MALVAGAAAAALCGCSSLPNYANPVEWFRDATGLSKNDALAQGRNSQNLEAGAEQPYPNLGSVPQPPDRATSAADRKKLQQSLAADRSNAKSSDEQLRLNDPTSLTSPNQRSTTSNQRSTASNQRSTASKASPPAVVPTPGLASSATANPGTATADAAGGRNPTQRPRSKPPEARSEEPAQESPLTAPSVRSVPEGDTPHPPPPAPGLAASRVPPTPVQQAATPEPKSPPSVPSVPPPQDSATDETPSPSPATAAASPSPGSADSNPVQTAMAFPPHDVSPPPPPSLAQPTVAATPIMRPGKNGKVSKQVAEIEFAKDDTRLTAQESQRLPVVVKRYQENGGTLRIVGYGRRGYGPDAAQEELQSFSKAIDRANAVAQALTKLGVPANNIVVQAAPVGDGLGEDRAEVLLEY